jgi:hypothetical protein
MAIVPLTVKQMLAQYPTLPPTALTMNIGAGESMTTVTDGVTFPCDGNTIILMKGGAASHVLTVKSTTDAFKRTGDIVYTLGIGLYAVLPKLQPAGFADASGLCTITSDASGTDVLFWAIREP